MAWHCQLFLASKQKNANTDCRENERATRPFSQRIPASLSRHLSRDVSERKQLWHDAIHEEMRTSVTGTGLWKWLYFPCCFLYYLISGQRVQIKWERNISPWLSGCLAEEQQQSDRINVAEKGHYRYPCSLPDSTSEACRYERALDLVLRNFMLSISDSGLEILCVRLSWCLVPPEGNCI